ncbi:tRNA wybutosine-synthesis-related protein 4 [Parastagonospora nodorum]|nr:tRNA wybutosine-synthesis-related protein 4 [Parastagonospora nodorum]KAH5644246.1 tRNA wybutosine-synthesis-related protein 4 [Parastagonospora nodorum]KAH6522939.1 tRNA wybutosine-synthesis-related protein 4 [Parastagonospora nodorum]
MMETAVVGLRDQDQAKTRPVPTELPDGATVHDAIIELLDNYHDINSQYITELPKEPTPLEFMRFVSRNQPFIVRSTPDPTFRHISKTWTPSYLSQKLADTPVTVALTPKGNADAVVHLPSGGSVFCKPYEDTESFSSALSQIIAQEKSETHDSATRYIQSQNDNLRSEYTALFGELPPSIPFASAALEQDPDAVNLWVGNSHSTSVLHKDHYENVFVQVAGKKEFVILPPISAPCVAERSVLSATYAPLDPELRTEDLRKDGLRISIDEPEEYVPLPTWDPDRPGENTTPYSEFARPMRVTVNAGDLLYLPALWYHKVKQIAGEEGMCCSVNYWYDMDFAGQFQVATRFVQEVAAVGGRGGGKEARE